MHPGPHKTSLVPVWGIFVGKGRNAALNTEATESGVGVGDLDDVDPLAER